jgi:hypothetical protein
MALDVSSGGVHITVAFWVVASAATIRGVIVGSLSVYM